MLVCLCNRVSEQTVRRAVEEGAESVSDLARACGAGADCGACWDDLRSLLLQGRAACAGCAGPAGGCAPEDRGAPGQRALAG